MSFRNRGLPVHVDTTAPAELDIQLFSVPDTTVQRIGDALERVPISPTDTPFGPLLRREVDGHFVYFLPAYDAGHDAVVLVVCIRPTSGEDDLTFRELVELVATFRGAIGI